MRKFLYIYLSLTILIFSASTLHAQIDLKKKLSIHLNINNGLLSNDVTCFVQDDKGFMWLGTTNGLCRFDGYNFKSYKSDYTNPYFFTGNYITCIAKDVDKLWIGTTSGLNVFDMKTEITERYSLKDIGCYVINSVVLDQDKNVYLATNRGVLKLDKKNKKFEQLKSSNNRTLEHSYIQSLFVDSRGLLWIGLWNTGFSVYDIKTRKLRFSSDLIQDHKKELSIMSFYEDRDKNIWISTWNTDGLYRITNPDINKTLSVTIYPVKYNDRSITTLPSIYNVQQNSFTGEIWIATSDGLRILKDQNNPNSVVDVPLKVDGVSTKEIFSIFKDRTGVMWLSMYGEGCLALDSNKKYFTEINNKVGIGAVTAIYEVQKNIFLLGVKSQTMVIFDRAQQKIIPYEHHPVLKSIDLKSNTIVAIQKHSVDNKLWFATRYYGLYVGDLKNGDVSSISHIDETQLKSANINTIEEGLKGIMWVGTIKGINYILSNSGKYEIGTNKVLEDIIGENKINTIWYDGRSSLWIGTQDNGLFKVALDQNGWPVDTDHYSLLNTKINNNSILCIYRDSHKRIWVGTHGGGLNLYNREKDSFELAKAISLFPDDAIYSIQEGRESDLWLATGKGLVRYNVNLPYEQMVRPFTINDNLEVNSFSVGSFYKSLDNEFFFGGNNGLVFFDPSTFTKNTYSPVPQITDILVSNVSIMSMEEQKKREISEFSPAFSKEIALSYKDKSLRIEFSSLAYENGLSYKYAYRLEGIDSKWVYTSAKNNFAVYNNLKKGKYKFYLKAYNDDGYSSEEALVLTIERLPAPWETIWAYILYTLLGALITYLILRVIINRVNLKRRLEMEHLELIKSREVHQAKLQFFTNISHELFTPITVLSCSLDDMSATYPQDESLIHTMKMNLNRLMRLLQQIMEFRKAETGNLKLKVSRGDIVKFIQEICDVGFIPMLKEKQLKLDIHYDESVIYGFFDSDKLDKIMFNLLSNAFKYNHTGGRIDIYIREENRNNERLIEISVADTGSGISEQNIPHLFTRFYEGDYRRFKTKGTGIGLSLTRDLVVLHRGEISVSSEKHKGTTFVVTFPIDEAAYAPDQIDYVEDSASETDVLVAHEYEEKPVVNSIEKREDKLLNLLLVEDNRDLLSIMAKVLGREFNMLTANDGQQALNIMQEEVVDIVVSDVLMPVMDGYELCHNIKSRVEWSHIPIILLTAKQSSEDKIHGFNIGADAYITKPFEMGVLVANLHSLVRNRNRISSQFKKEDKINISDYTYNNVDEEFLNRAIEIVEENVRMSNFSTTEFYQAMNMTQPTLYRKLKSITNLSPNEFIRNIKFKIACKLLTERGLNVSETAYELGFVDPRYFSSVFKKEIGMTPTEYLKQYEESEQNKQ